MDDDSVMETQREIEKTKQEAVESLTGEDGQPQDTGWGSMAPKGEPTPDTGLELFSNVLINTEASNEDYDFPELMSYIATGYMDNKELEALRRIHSVLANGQRILKTIEENMKVAGEKINMDGMEEMLLRKLFFLSYSSKSKNGFTVLELNSQHQYHHQNLYQRQEFGEDEGALGGLKEKLGGAIDKGMQSDRKIMPEKRESNDLW